jgi:hypothetical protein
MGALGKDSAHGCLCLSCTLKSCTLIDVRGDPASNEVELRFEIQRRQVSVLCQAAATLVSVFSRKIRLVQRYMTPSAGRRLLNQYMTCGFLVGAVHPLRLAERVECLGGLGECVEGTHAHPLPGTRTPLDALSCWLWQDIIDDSVCQGVMTPVPTPNLRTHADGRGESAIHRRL